MHNSVLKINGLYNLYILKNFVFQKLQEKGLYQMEVVLTRLATMKSVSFPVSFHAKIREIVVRVMF